ncbi:hypothetical protein L1049_011339 [Liquidambar formosana]|uniref:RING-type E3 ubiquitin transferase n=1 Tax=Liquidambar formosana TaxID=63359 RepID=A0AAP0RS04_LIQFO
MGLKETMLNLAITDAAILFRNASSCQQPQHNLPPFIMEEDKNASSIFPRLAIIIIGVASASFVVAIYHCIAVGWGKWRQTTTRTPPPPPPPRPRAFRSEQVDTAISTEHSTVLRIPARKYQKGLGLVGEDGTCAICLSEFEEGEQLRTLPECLHSFHAPCIDMWLYSHLNCPMCRADATPSPSPSPQIRRHSWDNGSSGLVTQHEPTVLPEIN